MQAKTLHYIAIVTESEILKPETFLSPDLMLWSSDLLLFDLRSCLSFWQQSLSFFDDRGLFFRELQGMIEERLGPCCYAFAAHPWQAILTVRMAKLRGLKGGFALSDSFTKKLYGEIAWDLWFQEASILAEHLASFQKQSQKLRDFKRGLKQWQGTMEKLAMPYLFDLKEAKESSIRRRYGDFFATIWHWTLRGFQGNESPIGSQNQGLFPHEDEGPFFFPWHSYELPFKPHVRRNLDHGIEQWDAIASYLLLDLEILCEQEGWHEAEKISLVSWQVTLSGGEELMIPIRFRHPYALHRERKHFSTFLQQAHYAFDDTLNQRKESGFCADEDDPHYYTFISWQLVIEERISLTQPFARLFSMHHDGDPSKLMELENQLPCSLDRYHLHGNYVPEASYGQEQEKALEEASYMRKAWTLAAKNRPLFIFKTPRKREDAPHPSLKRFLERVASDWWREHGGTERSYYVLTDHKRQYHWVYRDHLGQWYEHGIYS